MRWNRRNSSKFPGRAPHPFIVLYMLLLAVRLYKGREHAHKTSTNKREHEHTVSTGIYRREQGEHGEDARA